jgi:hypothetical protein
LCESGEIGLQLLAGGLEIRQVEFDAHIVPFGPSIGMLLAMEDVVPTRIEVLGYRGQQPFAIIALYEEDDFMHDNELLSDRYRPVISQ